MKTFLFVFVVGLAYLIHLDGKTIIELRVQTHSIWLREEFEHDQIRELRARLNAIEATVEPMAYDIVDFDNRLAKAEHSWRLEAEENDDDK